ncbi:MAG TPA: maltotransferase domain-containing protein [Caulobacteraceae bacterium]|jgi:starch synthase (maltosyl-transferring)
MAQPQVLPRRILQWVRQADGPSRPPASLPEAAARLGFDALAIASDAEAPGAADRELAAACGARGLRLLVDLDPTRFDAEHPLVREAEWAFRLQADTAWDGPLDPRRGAARAGVALARLKSQPAAELVGGWARERVAAWTGAGASGFRLLGLDRAPPEFWRDLIGAGDVLFIGDAAGLPWSEAQALAGCGLGALTTSLPWWDGRSRWIAEEYETLRRIAPPLSPMAATVAGRAAEGPGGGERAACLGRLRLGAAMGSGLVVPSTLLAAASDGGAARDEAVGRCNALVEALAPFCGEMRLLTPASAAVTAVLRADRSDVRDATRALLALINPDPGKRADPSEAMFEGAGADFARFAPLDGSGRRFETLEPGEVRLLAAERARPVRLKPQPARAAATSAAAASRIAIEAVFPAPPDGEDFAAKAVVGEAVEVEADIFAEGHSALAADLLYRPADRDAWRRAPMAPLGNDRWRGSFPLERLGRWEFRIEAWLDEFGGYAAGLAKKLAAGVARPVDFEEGRLRLQAAAGAAADAGQRRAFASLAAKLAAGPDAARAASLTAPPTAALMRAAAARPSLTHSAVRAVDADRLQARFASWYELFPRSQSDDPARHGTFDDVVARLPDIREMGFDVLYFPPIHPIGRTGRKGPDNSLTAGPDDPGSPYAIGGAEGGHTDIHPQLGSLDDFRRLVGAARQEGLEIALDFAIQCSPDHPWLRQRPDWFDWRPDGSLKFAENPPKTYEDIVNVDFYAPGAVPDLWLALRDVVRFWVREGVRIFRVDNPHTKPLPFWQWMIADIRRADPDVIFLAEAFTRPKLMYRLAKLGFTQSYTYFTWRHSKQEFTDYLTELTAGPPRAFFRPHFFVNTPDINPYFLQQSGRAGFLIGAALAATLSGLWGVYSGFELLECEPVPGKEEYRRSEKYEIKPRDWRAPGNIRAEIALLNRIRKGEPALQTHLNVRFYNAFNDQVLYFGKASPGGGDKLLVAISLDPHHPQSADFEIPLWEWGLPDDGALAATDLLRGRRHVWRGKLQHVALTPQEPFAIWRVEPLA